MSSVPTSLAQKVRTEVLSLEGVTRFSPNRRFALIYSEGSPADTVYFLESGLVKTYKRGAESKEIILEIVTPGGLFGLQAIASDRQCHLSAEILVEGELFLIPRNVFLEYCDSRPGMWRLIAEVVLAGKHHLEKTIELLCTQEVEYRVLYFMAELAETIGSVVEGHECSIPLSQGELACLIGATRETTSSALNALARRGLVRLGRRQLVVPSIANLRKAAFERITPSAPAV